MFKFDTCGFENLHVHTHYSLLDGYSDPDELASRATKINQQFLCVTDHGIMGAIPSQIRACEEHDIQPLFGCELYVSNLQKPCVTKAELDEFLKDLSPEEAKAWRKSYHLLAIAYNDIGYRNLVRLSSWGYSHGYGGFPRRPRVNHEQLMKHKEGIIFSSCCYLGEIGQAFDVGGEDLAYDKIEQYMAMFGDNFILEMMMLDFEKQKPYDKFIVNAHAKYHLPLILTQDCHYTSKEDAKYQQYMLMVRTENTIQDIEEAIKNDDTQRLFELQDRQLWYKSEEELNDKWMSDYQQIIPYEVFCQAKAETVKIANKAKGVKIDRSIKLPSVPHADDKFREVIEYGFKRRNLPDSYRKRLEEEYELICRKGFSSYFLLVQMMTDEARRVAPKLLGRGDGAAAVGPGRGCLSPDVSIRLDDGTTKSIEDIVPGEKVLTRDGSFKNVKRTLCYPIKNEQLVCINTFYGDAKGVTLTTDHEVLVEKHKLTKRWLRLSDRSRNKSRKYEEPSGNLCWMSAKEIEVGDWLYVPFPKIKTQEFSVDLARYGERSLKNGKRLWSDDEFVYHEFNVSGGQKSKKSVRNWKLDEEWAIVLGIFAGDGWLCSHNNSEIGFCFHSEEGDILNLVREKLIGDGLAVAIEGQYQGKKVSRMSAHGCYHRQLFADLFSDYAYKSHTKHVPHPILTATLPIVSQFVKGYFLADGHDNGYKIVFTTTSRNLADQLRFLLLRMGLPSSLRYESRKDDREEFKNTKPSFAVVCPRDQRICGYSTKSENTFRRLQDGLLLRVRKVDNRACGNLVYDLEVEDNHNYCTSSFLVHNSVCGSLAAYCMNIHDVDPIKHDLLFSRFISESRGGKQYKLEFSDAPKD